MFPNDTFIFEARMFLDLKTPGYPWGDTNKSASVSSEENKFLKSAWDDFSKKHPELVYKTEGSFSSYGSFENEYRLDGDTLSLKGLPSIVTLPFYAEALSGTFTKAR